MKENKEEKVNKLTLLRFEAVSRFKSVKRAWRRGHISIYGFIYPKRPFNNRTSKKNTRPFNELRKVIYGQLRSKDRVTQ